MSVMLPTPRRFASVKAALAWYAKARVGPRSVGNHGGGSGPSSKASREEREITHAAIGACLKGLPHGALLVAWSYAFDPPDQLARAWHFPSGYALQKAMDYTEKQLGQRMRDRGLIDERETA